MKKSILFSFSAILLFSFNAFSQFKVEDQSRSINAETISQLGSIPNMEGLKAGMSDKAYKDLIKNMEKIRQSIDERNKYLKEL